jgi:hypothetical protein
LLQIEPWHLGPVPTYRVNTHKDRRDIKRQTADSRAEAGDSMKGGIVRGLRKFGDSKVANAWEKGAKVGRRERGLVEIIHGVYY